MRIGRSTANIEAPVAMDLPPHRKPYDHIITDPIPTLHISTTNPLSNAPLPPANLRGSPELDLSTIISICSNCLFFFVAALAADTFLNGCVGNIFGEVDSRAIGGSGDPSN